MLNFDEQTGIGVLMIVWSFLLSSPLPAPMKTTLTIIPTYDPTLFTNNDTLYQLPLSLSSHTICIHTYATTIHLSIHHYLYIYAYQQAQTSYDVKVTIENFVPTSRRRIHPCCMIATWVKSASIDGLECESSYRQGLSLDIFEFLFEVILRTSMQALLCIACSCDSYCSKVYLPTCLCNILSRCLPACVTYYLAL